MSSSQLAANIESASQSSASAQASISSSVSCVDPTVQSEFKVYVAKSLNGPWVENGSACKGEVSYFKTTGVKASAAVKGCTNPSPGTGCLDLTKHRVFTAAETASGNIITTLSAAESSAYPLGEYSFFLSILGDKRILLEKVGVAKIINCVSTAPSAPPPTPAPVTCRWDIINPQPVVGGGNNVYPALTCSTATIGATGSGYYDMGSGNHLAQNYRCVCN